MNDGTIGVEPRSRADEETTISALMKQLTYAAEDPEWLRRKAWESAADFDARTWRVTHALRELHAALVGAGLDPVLTVSPPPRQLLRPAPAGALLGIVGQKRLH
jgi:hypothetical protein